MRHLVMIALALAVVACTAAGDGDEADSFVTTISCGWSDAVFSGRLAYKDSMGVEHGVADAEFLLPEDPPLFGRDFRVSLNPDGTFRSTLGVRISIRTFEASNDEPSSEAWIQEHNVLIQAPGCEAVEVRFTEDWTEHTVYLECPARVAQLEGSV